MWAAPNLAYQPVRRYEKLSVQVAERLQELIASGELRPGDRLPPERVLCDRFQVSRTVIREALSILKAKGLLASKGGSGVFVRAIQGEDVADSIGLFISTQGHSIPIEDLIEVRCVLEVQIASLAASRVTPEGIAELEQLMAGCRQAAGDPEVFARKDLEFHMALARLTGNSLLAIILEPFADALYEGRRLASSLPGVMQEAIELHQQILDKVKAQDAHGAARAMHRHLIQSRRVTLQALSRFNPKQPFAQPGEVGVGDPDSRVGRQRSGMT
mgnify:CR=1 FL=1